MPKPTVPEPDGQLILQGKRQPPADSLYVVAIGASAGGLEALSAFLNHLPATPNLAVIIAQHLSPTYKSHLVDLLSRETPWPVKEIASGLALQPGQVFIIPPDAEATLSDGYFQLHPPASAIGPKPSASLLFASLADQPGLHPIAVILSGTGSDGASGLAAVKRVGGWCLAQEPDSARYDGMPMAAIRSGDVDFVLPPQEMGPQIQALIKNPELLPLSEADEDGPVSDAFGQIMQLLTQTTGTDFANYKSSTIMRRLQKRLLSLQQHSLESYLLWIKDHPRELDELFNSLLIGVTGFFRDPEVFAALEVQLRALLAHKTTGDTLRIWAPGCASGEEAYSIAMLVEQLMLDAELQLQVQIFATDISEASIAFARQGIYSEAALTQLPEALRKAYFSQGENGFQLSKTIRSRVLFSRHDITVNPPFLKLDLISCRNLLIYFGANLQKHIMPIFHYALNPDGILLLGKSETIGQFSDLFATLDARLKFFRRRSNVASGHQVRHFSAFKPLRSGQVKAPMSTREERSLNDMLRDTLFSSFEFPYVVINESLDILQVSGNVSDYLSLAQGRMSTSLLKLCRQDLQIELRSLTSQCLRERKTVSGSFRRWPERDSSRLLRLKVLPVEQDQMAQELFLISFEHLDLAEEFIPLPVAEPALVEQARMQELEHELAVTREHLQAFVEELETSNEELQALNEELQSANEELETANEELQATNEEMQVAYAELRTANEVLERKEGILQQSQTHMQALLENTHQGFILIDRDYRVQAMNTEIQKIHQRHFQRALQAGQPVLDAFDARTLNELLPLMQSALQGQRVIQNFHFAIPAADPRWYRCSLVPVQAQAEDPVQGLTLSFQDMTAEIRAQIALEQSNALIDSVFDATDTGICVTDDRGFFVRVNEGYCNIYGYRADEMLGEHFTLVVMAEQKQMATELHDAFIAGAEEIPGEWKVQRKDGRFIDIFASARLLINPDGSRFKVTTVRDISDSKKYRDLLNDTQQASGVGGWELDLIHQTLQWTPEVYAIYGLKPGTPVSLEQSLAYFAEEARHKIEQAVQQAQEKGDPFDMELAFVNASGQNIWVRTTCKPIRVYNKTVKLFGTFQDVTQRHLAEEDKLRLIDELTHKNEDLKQFTYIISHNLRAPVANLLGLVSLLQDEQVESEILQSISRSASKLDEVIQDLNLILSMRREDQGHLYQEVDLELELSTAMQSLTAPGEHLPEIHADLGVTRVLTIRSYLQSILFNLLSNAIKYASPKRPLQIQVRSWKDNRYIYLSVQDNGRGFDPSQAPQLFRLYKRLHPQIAGKGLGLYLVKTQAEALGGGVDVSSSEDQGSCFTVHLRVNHV